MALLAGTVAVVLTRCVTPRQAYQAIDVRLLVFLAGPPPPELRVGKRANGLALAFRAAGAVLGVQGS